MKEINVSSQKNMFSELTKSYHGWETKYKRMLNLVLHMIEHKYILSSKINTEFVLCLNETLKATNCSLSESVPSFVVSTTVKKRKSDLVI